MKSWKIQKPAGTGKLILTLKCNPRVLWHLIFYSISQFYVLGFVRCVGHNLPVKQREAVVPAFAGLAGVTSFSFIIGPQKLSRAFRKHVLNLKVSLKVNSPPFL